MYIERSLEKMILRYLPVQEIIAVVGPRQAGKTTLLKRIYEGLENAVYMNFEDKELLDLFVNDLRAFAKLYAARYRYLFIDEFHYAEEGGKKLKYLYDEYPEVKIIITGSSSLDVSVKAVKYLVGRVFVFPLYPLSFREYISYVDPPLYEEWYLPSRDVVDRILEGNNAAFSCPGKEVIQRFHRHYSLFVRYGGYPRVVTSGDEEEKKIVLKNIYNTYFLREIRDALNLSTDRELRLLIKALSLQTGGLVSYTKLQQVTGFTYQGLMKHLEILDKTYVAMRVLPYYTNKRKEIVKSPKVYFYDTGLRNHAVGDFSGIDDRVDGGVLNENFVATELLKREREFRYWRTKARAEVDFIVGKRASIPVEVKSRLHRETLTKSYISFMRKYNPPSGMILSNDYCAEIEFEGKQIFFLPLSLF